MARNQARARLFGRPAEPIRLGRFVILSRLGSGGMGVVYEAYDPQLDRKVALKLLRSDAEASAPSRPSELGAEARAMARLSHPNVVTVFDVGEVDGRVYIAMEYVPPPTLRAWLEAEPRGVEAIVAVMLEAGAGLAAAHRAGLVHRDFKPKTHPPPLTPRHSPKWPRISKQRGFTRGGRVSGCLCMPRRYPKFCQKHGME